jgi:hypothetical protein
MGITTEAGSCVTASVKSNSSGFSSYVSLLKFLRTFFGNVTTFEDAISTEIPHRNVNASPGVNLGSGRIGVGCWARTIWARKNKKAKADQGEGRSLSL